jgi:hypothetical protein
MTLLSKLGPKKRVRIPFARKLAANFPLTIRARRDFSKLLAIVKTHAFLYALQRKEEDHAIIATEEDLKQAVDAAFPFFKYTFTGITRAAGEILDVMRELRVQNIIATHKTIARQAKKGETWVKRNMKLLIDAGLVLEEVGKPIIFELADEGIDTIDTNRLLGLFLEGRALEAPKGDFNPISRIVPTTEKTIVSLGGTIHDIAPKMGASAQNRLITENNQKDEKGRLSRLVTIKDDRDDCKRAFIAWAATKGGQVTLDEIELAFAKGELAYFTGFEEWLDELIKLGDLSRPEPKTLSLKRA